MGIWNKVAIEGGPSIFGEKRDSTPYSIKEMHRRDPSPFTRSQNDQPTVLSLSSLAGGLWYLLDRKHRKIAESNICLSLQISRAQARKVAKENFLHLVRVFVEFPLMRKMTIQNYRCFVEPHGQQFLIESLRRGRGALILTGHFGNWEWMAYSAPFFLPSRLNLVARPLRPSRFNRWVTKLREGSGNRVIRKELALLHTVKAIKKNEIVGFLLDHNAGKKTGVWTPFFGGYVLTHKTLAYVALRTGAPVHPAFNWRMRDGRYRIEIGPEIPKPPAGTLEERTRALTASFTRIIEEHIQRIPQQWYWIHRRFRRFRTKL